MRTRWTRKRKSITPKRKSKAAAVDDDEGVTPKKKGKKAKVEDEETAVKEEIDEMDVL